MLCKLLSLYLVFNRSLKVGPVDICEARWSRLSDVLFFFWFVQNAIILPLITAFAVSHNVCVL